jgi:hypothetical protein
MKKSTAVTLVISGALMVSCHQRPYSYYGSSSGTNGLITNNTYVAGRGYWHAPFYDWYPYPYNYFRPGYGYYHGGMYSSEPQLSTITSSAPRGSSSGFFSGGSSGSGWSGGSHGSFSGSDGGGVSRGGFGGIGHGFGGHGS